MTATADLQLALPKADTRVAALDGLRGIAVLLIIVYHLIGLERVELPPAFTRILRVVNVGWCGVDLFFVLSGFLITGILLNAKGKPHYFRNFYARRTLRIFPLYYLSLGLMFAPLLFMRKIPSDVQHTANHQGWAWAYLTNFYTAFTGDFLDNQYFYLGGLFWSLAVEEHFYLVWPAVVRFLRPRALLATCCVLIVAAFLSRWWMIRTGWSPIATYLLTFCRMDSLLFGAVVAICMRGNTMRTMFCRWAPAAAAAAVMALAALFLRHRGIPVGTVHAHLYGHTLFAVLFAAGIVMLQSEGPWRALCEWRWLQFSGRYSYGLYVYQAFILPPLWRFHLPEWFQGATHSLVLGAVAHAALAIVLLYAVAFGSFHLFEDRFLRLRKLFHYVQP